MAVAADLVIPVRARTDGLKKDLNKSKGILNDFASGFGKGGLFGKIVGGVAIGTVIGSAISSLARFAMQAAHAFYSMAKAQSEAIDTTTKLSYQLGVGTETLQAMQLSAQLANVSAESFAKGMIKMRDNAVAAAQGNDKMQESFQRLGISASDIATLPLDQQFNAISEAVRKMGGNVEAQSAIIDIFGRHAGPELYTMLIEGKNGIEAMRNQLERLGLTFSNVEGNQVEVMNDALEMIKESFYGVGRAIVIGVAPYLKEFADWVLRVIENMDGVRTYIFYVIDAFKIFAKAALYPIKVIHDSWNNLKIIILSVADVIVSAVDRVLSMAELLPDDMRPQWIDDTRDAIHDFQKFARDKNSQLTLDNAQFLNVDAWFAGIEKGSRKTAQAANHTRKQFAAWGGEIDEAADKMQKVRDLAPSGEMTYNSQAAANAIANAQRQGSDTNKAIEKNTKEQVGILKSIDGGIKKLGKMELAPANL